MEDGGREMEEGRGEMEEGRGSDATRITEPEAPGTGRPEACPTRFNDTRVLIPR